MAEYYVFRGTTGTQMVITSDDTGAKLPRRELGVWALMKTVSIAPGGGPLIGADSDAVIAGVEKDGYYLWPQPERS
jgi:hypothetical protein